VTGAISIPPTRSLRRLRGRRRKRFAALALLAAAGLAGCGGGGAASATGAGAHTFTDLVAELPTSLDETATPSPASASILPSWSSELVRPAPAAPGPDARLPPDGAVVPYLATSWQRSSDGSYTFELRRGVHGATGDLFTANDVKWSLDRALARSPVAPFLFALAHIDVADPVTILSSHRVRINVSAPSPFTLSVLASYDAGIYDGALYRAHAGARDPWAQQWGATHSASFGAYWVTAFTPRRELDLEANPGFWRRPYYTRVVIRLEASSAGRLAAVLAGSATHTSGLNWSDFASGIENAAADGVRLAIGQTGPAVVAWHLDVASGPLANPLVREAINLGINRGELADPIDAGYDRATVLTIPAAFGARQPTSFDPVQSRSLLRAAGYPNGITLNLYTNDAELGGGGSSLLNSLTDDMAQIGVTLQITEVDDTDQLLALEQSPGVQSSIETDTPLLGGAGFLLEQDANTTLDPVSRAAEQHYGSASLQALLDQLTDSPGGSPTQTLITQAASAIDAETPTINLVAIPVQNVTRADVTGYAAYTQPVIYYEHLHPTG
jgi:ABC-type transport system substrate-binding protein